MDETNKNVTAFAIEQLNRHVDGDGEFRVHLASNYWGNQWSTSSEDDYFKLLHAAIKTGHIKPNAG